MSKKRWCRLACLTVVCAVLAATVFTSCTFIKENEDRVANAVIATVKADGMQTTVTRNEVLDYYNSYAYYLINYNGMSAEEALDWAVENKIKSKYLTLKAIAYLRGIEARKPYTVAYLNRGNVAPEQVSYTTAESVLTLAEWYAAVYSVNDSLQSTLDGFVETSKQSALTSRLSQAKRTDVKEIQFTDATKAYLKEEYWVGEELDTDRVQIVIVYDDDTQSEAYTLPDSYYSTAFTSESAGEQTLAVKFDERIENGSEVSYETHTLEHAYTVVEGRATKNKPDEETNVDDVSIGEKKVNRYATKEEIKAALGEEEFAKLEKIDVAKKYEELRNDVNADSDLTDAYRQLNENITNNHRTSEYYYLSAYESAVTSALQAEVYKTAQAVSDDEVITQFRYLYETGKTGYAGVLPKDYADTFAAAIKSDRESLYYYPEIGDIDEYFYVYQILFNFSDEQKNFVTDNTGDDEELKEEYYEALKGDITTKESNPNYDSTFHCPLHEKKEEGAVCKWRQENPDSELLCPSLAYIVDEDGKTIERKFIDVYNELQQKLRDIYDATDKTQEQKSSEAFAVFEDYMYRFNDDGGIMNSSSGYLIAPESIDDPNGFYEQFLELARAIAANGLFVGNAFETLPDASTRLAYRFTPYGVHLICISSIPFANAHGELTFDFDSAQGKEAVVQYLKQSINLKGDTLYKKLKDALVTERRSQVYSTFTTNAVPENVLDDADKVQINGKVKDKLVKDMKG